MAITRNERSPVSWDDLLSAISPQRGFANTDLRRAVDVITTAHQDGQITDEEAEELIKMLIAFAMSGQVNAVVSDFFTPDVHGRLGIRFGRGEPRRYSHRFSF